MAYVLLVLLVILVAGLVVRLVLAAGRPKPGRADEDTVDLDVRPPPHPDAPIPGSDARRHQQGKP